MKKHLPLLLLSLALCFNTRAQYVTIPDTAFVSWLNANGFATCMNGNQLDTTCSPVLNATGLYCNAVPIRDLTGVQYFKNIDSLDCSNDSLYTIPALPTAALTYFDCQYNNLSSLPALPATLLDLITDDNSTLASLPALPPGLQYLACSGLALTGLPALPSSLTYLDCWNNPLTALPTLPSGLIYLICDNDHLSALPALPSSISSISCSENQLTSLPTLPSALYFLDCHYNQLTVLPALPSPMQQLYCRGNQLTGLPAMPPLLQWVDCSNNLITALPTLPAIMKSLSCAINQISSLPALPSTLLELLCANNHISSMPVLPSHMQTLSCDNNQLTVLPLIPATMVDLECAHNLLTSLPTLPDSLYYFDCSNNTNLACLPELKRIEFLYFDTTAVTCLPDYGTVTFSHPALNTLPLCGIFNPGGCGVYWNISGTAFFDANNDCALDSTDVPVNYAKIQLYSAGQLQQQVYTGGLGDYSFLAAGYGNYNVQIDTTNLPFTLNCNDTGYIATTLSASDSLSYENNFALKCRTDGFDIGVQSIIYAFGIARPAALVVINSTAGDMSQLYGAHCAAGVSGQVQLTFTGPVTYVGPAYNALTPTTVTGNTITWTIADYGAINDFTAFNVVLQVNSNAVAGDPVCINVNATPTTGDYNPANNSASYCFNVVNALDPNEKEVDRTSVEAGNTPNWLTYTIRFQNTGSAPALNIKVTDTLSSYLDPSSFQLLAYSAKTITQILGNTVVFNFPNINLPDSLTSDSASRGYVQFKIKTVTPISANSVINNTASIYFDLNSAVVTNTVSDTAVVPLGINSPAAQSNILVTAYPNPFSDITNIEITGINTKYNFELYDVTGRLQLSIPSGSANHFQIAKGNLAPGAYLYHLATGNNENTAYGKLIIQ